MIPCAVGARRWMGSSLVMGAFSLKGGLLPVLVGRLPVLGILYSGRDLIFTIIFTNYKKA